MTLVFAFLGLAPEKKDYPKQCEDDNRLKHLKHDFDWRALHELSRLALFQPGNQHCQIARAGAVIELFFDDLVPAGFAGAGGTG